MKSKIIMGSVALFTVLGSYCLVANMDLEYNKDVLAADATLSSTLFNVDCTDATLTSRTPSAVDYNITAVASALNGPVTYTATSAVLTNAVDGDTSTTPTVRAFNDTIGMTNVPSGYAYIEHQGPYAKMSGLQCLTNNTGALRMYGDGSDTNTYDVSFGNADINNTWVAAEKIDALPSTSAIIVFGTSGLAGSGIPDGSDRVFNLNALDGEIAIGGAPGTIFDYEVRSIVDVTGIDVANASQAETVNWIFAN